MHVLHQLLLNMLYPLVKALIDRITETAWWDAATLGLACLDVAVKRIFMAEVGRAHRLHRISVYVDLTTFYATIRHSSLVEEALDLGFPAHPLQIALHPWAALRLPFTQDAASLQGALLLQHWPRLTCFKP